MIDENQENINPSNNFLNVLVGMLIGSLAGALTMLLLAPQSGKDTRMKIRDKGTELRDKTTKIVEETMEHVRSSVNELTDEGREKIRALKQHGQDLAVEQLDHVSEAAQAGKKAIQSS